MKILALTPQLPYPPMQGTTLRNFYLLRELARRHEISLLTFVQLNEMLGADSPLHAFCRAVRTVPVPPRRGLAQRALTSIASPLPDMALRLPSGAFTAALREWLAAEQFDIIQVEGIEMAAYGMQARQAGTRARLVFDDHNAEYVLQRSAFQSDARRPSRWHAALYSFVQWQKLARYERQVLRGHDAVAAVSQTDARALQQIAPGLTVHVVPNGVDTAEFMPASSQPSPSAKFAEGIAARMAAAPPRPESPLGSAARPASPEGPKDGVRNSGDVAPADVQPSSPGSADHASPPRVPAEGAQDQPRGIPLERPTGPAEAEASHTRSMPLLDGTANAPRLTEIVFTGKMDYRPNIDAVLWFAESILPLVRAQVPAARFVIVGQQPHARLAPLAARDDVLLTGWVEDVKPYIAGAAVYVAPLRMGGGTRLKVLQAMSMAKPIVSTTLGCDGLSVQSGREALLADMPEAFAAAVVRLLREPSLGAQLGARARALAIAQYDWRLIGPLMEACYAA